MELLQLRYFLESSKTESFTKTAEKYMVPSSSVSASIKRLEAEVGCELFDRSANRILLNDKGRQFQKKICSIFDELDDAVSEINSHESPETEIKILIRSSRSHIIRKIITFNKKHPDIRFDTSLDFYDNDYDKYDIIIDVSSNAYDKFDRFELSSDRIGIIAAEGSNLCGRPLCLSQLKNQSFIITDKNSNLHRILLKVCKEAGFTPNISITTNDLLCYLKCVREGAGLALAGYNSVARAEIPGISFLYVTDFNERHTTYAYYKKHYNSIHINRFLNTLKN